MWFNSSSVARAIAVLCLTHAVVPVKIHASNAVEKQLRDQYRGRTLIIRNFYAGTRSQYDSTGSLTNGATQGDWTVDGFLRVSDVRVSANGLRLRGTRQLAVVSDKRGFEPVSGERREIDVRLDSGEITLERANTALSRVFLTATDHLEELVPNYWKPCFQRNRNQPPVCHFSPELLAVPGVSPSATGAGSPSEGGEADIDSSVLKYKPGKGVKAPRAIAPHDPEFSEAARSLGLQGTVVLGLVVDASGNPTKIRVINPLGCGLDEQAVRSVAAWHFSPGEKDGQPVSVEIAVEVDFRLWNPQLDGHRSYGVPGSV
jgi:TonB family protein